MKRQMKLLIGDDATVQDVKLARAKEKHDRNAVFNQLVASGDVSIMMDMDPAHVRVRVDDEFFTDERSAFPSTQLMARVQLALHAGLSDKVQSVKERMDGHLNDALRYGFRGAWGGRAVTTFARDSHIGDFTECDWNPEPKITATVNPRTKTRKGLRP